MMYCASWPSSPSLPRVFTSSELSEVYSEALAALKTALTPPPEEDTKKPRKGTAERQRKKPVQEPPPPPPKYPPVWDGASIAVLDALLAERATVTPAAVTPLPARADATKACACVPPNGRRLLRRVMRSLVLKMAAAVEDKLGVVRADLGAKAAAAAEDAA
ncbi:hypothetical protein Vretifemale_1923 [Volvox reticuliferus]|nr:hypothetical protein Vretifemale_1923 [Volvox reticuliferus]